MKRRYPDDDNNVNPSKKHRINRIATNTNNKLNKASSDNPSNRTHHPEIIKINDCVDLIVLLNKYISSIKEGLNDEICLKYKNCENILFEAKDNKLREIAAELIETEKCINYEYETKEMMIKNHCKELELWTKQKLIEKYMDKKSKQKTLFQQHAHRNGGDVIFLNDVNKMVGHHNRNIAKKYYVSYKSKKNILQIEGKRDMILKIGHRIAVKSVKHKTECIMIGYIKTISSEYLSCSLREKGDKLRKYSSINIPIRNIEYGNIRIKLID